MPRRFFVLPLARLDRALLALATLALGIVANAAPAEGVTRSSEAPALVQSALDAELVGDAARRAALIAEALKADPDFAPARWHNGQVKFDGQWRTLEEVQAIVATDPRWAGYRELRAGLGASPRDHLVLAEYCREHDLVHEGRYHWSNVLLANPRNKAAWEYLGLQVHRGWLFTAEQVAAMDRAANDAEANLKRHRAALTRLCRDATRGDRGARAQALGAIAALSDPTMIAALEVAAEKACEKSPKFADDLHQAVVAALANMPQHEATLRLLNHAVYSDSPEVRQAAARALRPRPQTDYVPLLMAALRAPVEAEFDILAMPDGSVRLSETIHQAGPVANREHQRQTDMLTLGVERYDSTRANPAAVLRNHLGAASARLAKTEADVIAVNARAEAMNMRIEEVLGVVTGESVSESAETWWANWESYNELQSLAEESVIRSREGRESIVYYPERPDPNRPKLSCFVPGTPVWTPSGAVPIEELVVGDLVLAQNPHSGEVDFRPILAVTVGAPAPTHDLMLGKETIGATRGHRFWAPGQGWKMTKQLTPGERLLSLKGSVELSSMRDGETVSCYNLVVEGFHTYFVGESRILVHDTTCPEPELASVPGSATTRAWNPAVSRSPVSIER